jgi:hypothetical protein
MLMRMMYLYWENKGNLLLNLNITLGFCKENAK